MDVCLVFGVETGRGVVGCAGAPVSGYVGGGGVLKKGILGTLGQMDVLGL